MLVNCDNCSNVFEKKIAEIKRTKRNLCSKKCTGDILKRENRLKFYDKTELNNECMEWQLALNKHGYGLVRHNGKLELAHRVSYLISIGDMCGAHVLHTCDNPKCVNPSHLFIGNHQDNMIDMRLKGRDSTKLSRDNVLSIRQSKDTNNSLSIQYGVSERTIRYAKNIKNWMPLPSSPINKETQ